MERFNYTTRILSQYATTTVDSVMRNPSPMPQEVSFTFLISDDALITNLSMTVNDVEHVAKLKEKVRAQKMFDIAREGNNSAILLSVNFTRRNEVKLATNIKAFQNVGFKLAYEEYIPRKNGSYSHNLKVVSEVAVDKMESVVIVKQNKLIRNILLSDVGCKTFGSFIGPKKLGATITTKSSLHCQLQNIGTDGRIYQNFSVQYILEESNPFDVAADNSYFAYFFTPEVLTTFPKHVVCVIDISGSMWGDRLQQTQDTLVRIIDSLNENDRFNLITFSSQVYYWPPSKSSLAGKESNKKDAIEYVRGLRAWGMTNINDALLAGIEVLNREKKRAHSKQNTKQFIYFLTDGGATEGVTDTLQILANVKSVNYDNRFPIHGLAFGSGSDFDLIQKVSQENQGKAVRYE